MVFSLTSMTVRTSYKAVLKTSGSKAGQSDVEAVVYTSYTGLPAWD